MKWERASGFWLLLRPLVSLATSSPSSSLLVWLPLHHIPSWSLLSFCTQTHRERAEGMASSVVSSGLRALPTWSSSVSGGDEHHMSVVAVRPRARPRPLRSPATMGNVNEGKGIFAPLVVVVRNIVGRKRFNQLRGKAIALHSQVITEFCKTIGADPKQRQGLIRLAKKNGEKLGFLA